MRLLVTDCEGECDNEGLDEALRESVGNVEVVAVAQKDTDTQLDRLPLSEGVACDETVGHAEGQADPVSVREVHALAL